VTLSIDGEFRRDRLAMWIVAVLLLLAFLYVAWRYVGTVMLGLFAYYVTRPVFDRIYARVGNRTLAVAVSIFTVALPVLVLGGWTAVVAIQGLLDVMSSTGLEQVRDLIEPYVDLSAVQGELLTVGEEVLEDPRQLATIGGNGIGGAFATVLGTVALLFNVFLRLFIVLVIAFYLLKDDYRVASWARDTFRPARERGRALLRGRRPRPEERLLR
jgi:predicted PurR-regulated permease PerM